MSFTSFKHVQAEVEAIQLSAATQNDILTALSAASSDGQFSTFSFAENSETGCADITFRYKTDSTNSVLSAGSYLVKLPTGQFTVRTADEFNASFVAK